MPALINLNTAAAKHLTELPGISKTIAYNIVNHRKRHGYFTDWRELLEVKQFPEDALDKIKRRATLVPVPAGERPAPPIRVARRPDQCAHSPSCLLSLL